MLIYFNNHFFLLFCQICESRSVVSNSSKPNGLYSPWNSPGQNTGKGSFFLLQGIVPNQGSNTVSHIAGSFFTRWATKKLISQSVNSVTQSFPTLYDPMDCSMPGLPVHHQLPVHYPNSCPLSRWCHLMTSSSVVSFFSLIQSFLASGSFQISKFFTSDSQNIGVSASTWVFPMNIQARFPLRLTVWS